MDSILTLNQILFLLDLNEDIIRKISDKKGEPEWMTDWRLKAY